MFFKAELLGGTDPSKAPGRQAVFTARFKTSHPFQPPGQINGIGKGAGFPGGKEGAGLRTPSPSHPPTPKPRSGCRMFFLLIRPRGGPDASLCGRPPGSSLSDVCFEPEDTPAVSRGLRMGMEVPQPPGCLQPGRWVETPQAPWTAGNLLEAAAMATVLVALTQRGPHPASPGH